MDTRIVWFRRDLRLDDHPALHAALDDAGDDTRVVPLFVRDPAISERGHVSPARLAYLCEALADLDGALRDRGARLVLRHGDPADVVPATPTRCSRRSCRRGACTTTWTCATPATRRSRPSSGGATSTSTSSRHGPRC